MAIEVNFALFIAVFAAVSKRVNLAYEEDKGEVAQRPQGGDDNVKWLLRSILPSLLLVSLPCRV
jgi:hypothetical protein